MTNVIIYWRDFRHNWVRKFGGGSDLRWHSNAKLLGNLAPGDKLWMVTSGKNVRQDTEQAGFLVAVWQVAQVTKNPGDDAAYPADEYQYRVVMDEAASITLDQPVPVDHLLRPEGRDRDAPIGRFLQGPRKLGDGKVRLLRSAAGPYLAHKWLVGSKHELPAPKNSSVSRSARRKS